MGTLSSTNISLFKHKQHIRSKSSHSYIIDLSLVKKLEQLDFNKALKDHKYKVPCEQPFHKGYLINKKLPSIETFMSKIEFGSHINNPSPLVFKTLFDNCEREVDILNQIKDLPNTVQIIDVFIHENKKVLVFPKLKKIDIKKLDLIKIATHIKRLLNTLVELNRIGLAHMDVTPENLMIDSKEEIALIDFGLAKFYNSEPIEACGTMGYIAPELLNDGDIYPEKLDIYSLGCVFGIMLQEYIPQCDLHLLGCSLFSERNLDVIIDKLDDFLYARNTLYPSIIFDATEMLLSMLNPDPTIRFDAKELLNAPFISSLSDEELFLNTDYETIHGQKK